MICRDDDRSRNSSKNRTYTLLQSVAIDDHHAFASPVEEDALFDIFGWVNGDRSVDQSLVCFHHSYVFGS
jgi:hypothetical protein